MQVMEILLRLKAAIETSGGVGKFQIGVSSKTFDILKDDLSGIFNETDTDRQIEGLDGIEIWDRDQ